MVLFNRDHGAPPRGPDHSGGGVNEMVIKTLVLSIPFDDDRYVIHSELEVERGYVDLCLLVRPTMRHYGFFDLLFEFKLVRRAELGRPGRELIGMDEATLRQLPPVARAFAAAREQAESYRSALLRQERQLDLRSYAVVAVGLERILGEEVVAG